MQSKSLALVGCGMWGKNIARVLAEMGALKVICDPDKQIASRVASELHVEFTTDLEATLDDPRVAAVAIATPAATHAEVARLALHANKHVYVEKPIALSTKDANEVALLAAKKGAVLMVGHLLQFHPGFMKLLELIRHGALGTITYVYSNRLNQGRIRMEENALWSLAPHDFSMILSIAGCKSSGITANGAAIIQPGVFDLVTVHMSFANGLKAHIFCSWLSPFKEHKLTIIGDGAMAILDDTPRDWAEKTLKLCAHKVVRRDGFPEFVRGSEELIPFGSEEPLKSELAHFLTCVSTGSKPRTDAAEAIPVLESLESAQRALELSQV